MSRSESTTTPEFSVIVPTRNRPELLAEAVASIRAQTRSNVEIVVVDEASDPPVSGLGEVTLVRHEIPVGPGAARNAGVARSVGRVLTFLDDDDLWLPERLALAERGLARAPVAVCASRFVHEPSGGRVRDLEGDVSGVIRDGMVPNLGQTAVQRSAWLPLDETLPASAEVDWWLRIAREHEVATEHDVGFLYRVHDEPRTVTGPSSRIVAGETILANHADYFASHRAGAAFQWFRLGLTAAKFGDFAYARRAYLRSLRHRPDVRVASHLVRTLHRSRASVTV